MKRIVKSLFASLCFSLISISLFSQGDNNSELNIVTSSVPFLRISPDSRAGGMGDLGVATSPDANSQFYNLAKYAFASNASGLGMTYTPWLKNLGVNDVYLASLAGYYKLDENQALSGSLRFFSLGTIELTDGLGNPLGVANGRESAIDLGYSRKLSDFLSLGVGIRYINSNLTGNFSSNGVNYKPGNTVSGDLGLYYSNLDYDGNGLSMGLALTNLGAKIGYTSLQEEKDFIPANLTLGVVYTTVSNEVSKLSFGGEIHKLMVPSFPAGEFTEESLRNYRSKSVVSSWFSSFGDAPGGFGQELKEYSFSVGAEYTYQEKFFLRGGYYYEDKRNGGRQQFSIGTGFTSSNLGFNFSYIIPTGSGVTQNPLSNTMRFSLLFNFGILEN